MPNIKEKTARCDASMSDTQLLTLLREGNSEAYEQLWCRYIGLAMHIARGYAPNEAEDLVSESFLAVYRQVAVEGKGPREAFRPYLLTTMRNLAIRWGRDGRLIDIDAEIDAVDPADPLAVLSSEAEAHELLSAFQSLPERWQRVLWLAEIEDVPRHRIAAELSLTPNAVSVLRRRARAGLRVQWLKQQIPRQLAADPAHVARSLPDYIVSRHALTAAERKLTETHLAACRECSALHGELRSVARSAKRGALSLAGFAALAGVLPASSASTGGAAGAAALLLGAGAVGISANTALAAGVVIAASGALTAALLLAHTPSTGSSEPSDTADHSSESHSAPTGDATVSDETDTAGGAHSTAPAESDTGTRTTGTLGRGVHNPSIPTIPFTDHPNKLGITPPPLKPQPSTPDALPSDRPTGTPVTPPALTSPTASAAYFAPVITGTAMPSSEIYISISEAANPQLPTGTSYSADIASDGTWSFDPRGLDLQDGEYRYTVWAVRDGTGSAPLHGSFSILPPGVSGLAHPDPLPLQESSTTGTVIELTGAPNGLMIVVAALGGATQIAAVQLDANGTAVQRLRLYKPGVTVLVFANYADGYPGPQSTWFVPVVASDESPESPLNGGRGAEGGDIFELSTL